MKSRIILILTILSFASCRNYNSKDYINSENEAIQEIIPLITDFENMFNRNNKNVSSIKLYLISTLGTRISDIYELKEEYITFEDGVELSESEILEKKNRIQKEINKAEREKELFADLIDETIKERKLDYKFDYPILKIELISKNTEIDNHNFDGNEFGYLYISRIIFNRNFDKGYLSYSFFCGSACAWNNNIEIQKIDGHWKITEIFSGAIA